jgi:hypothetical protein
LYADGDDSDDGSYEGISDHGRALLRWKEQHLLAKSASLDPTWIKEPNPVWGSRFRNEKHLATLDAAFKASGSINEHVNVILESYEAYEAMLQWRQNRTNADLVKRLDLSLLAKEGRGYEAFAGDHTRCVVTNLRRQYPKTGLWQLIPKCEVYVAPPTPETRRMLRILSNQDNINQGLQLKQDFETVVEQMHRHLHSLESEYPDGVPPQAVKDMRNDLLTSKVVESVATAKQIYSICCYQGETWELIMKILRGEMQPLANKKKAPPPPKSCYPFNLLPTIPDPVIKTFLQKVVAGEWTISAMRNNCKLFKAKRRLRREICEILVARTDVKSKCGGFFPTWVQVVELYPALGNKFFLEPWCNHVSEMKLQEEMPASFLHAVSAIILKANKRQVRAFYFAYFLCLYTINISTGGRSRGQRLSGLHLPWLPYRSLLPRRAGLGKESPSASLS